MDAAHYRREIEQVFRREQQLLDDLTQTLEQEEQAILAQDTSALERTQDTKLERIRAVEALDARLAALLQQAGFSHDADGVHACLQWCDGQGGLQPHWDALLQAMSSCREHNRRNGATLELHRQHTRSALSVLRGQPLDTATYEASGASSQSDGGRRTIAKA